MWIIWILFFMFSSEVFGKEENKTSHCDSFKGLQYEPDDPTQAFKFVPSDKTYTLSRNNSVKMPCIFRNLAWNDIIWRKGEKIICDGDKFICKNFTSGEKYHTPGSKVSYRLFEHVIQCGHLNEPGQHLLLSHVQHEDAGEYFCEVKSSHQVLSKIKINVVDTEFSSVNQTFTVAEGDNVTLPCEVKDIGDGYVPLWIYDYYGKKFYLFDGMDLYPEANLKLEGYNLQIQNITRYHTGDYSCVLDTEPNKVLTHKVIVTPTPEPFEKNKIFPPKKRYSLSDSNQ